MSETETAAVEQLIAAPETILRIDDGDVLERIIKLGSAAEGIEVITLEAPEGVVGVPKAVPVARHHGASPKLASVKEYFDAYRTGPERRKGTAAVTTLASFVALVTRHKNADSVIFANTSWPNPKLTAVIDYHQADGGARFCNHKIDYSFPITPEFKAWMDYNGKPIGQGDFAAFLEDRIADLAEPSNAEKEDYNKLFNAKIALPNEIMELSRGLQVTVSANVKNAHTLQSGEVQINWTEEHKDQNGVKLIIPGLFMIATPVFIDGKPVRLPARLRYRVREEKITWSYHLYKCDYWLRQRVKEDLATAVKETGLPAFEGKPEEA